MSRTDFLMWVLMITVIFWLWSTGRHGLAFSLMSLYAITGGILYKLECDLFSKAMDLLDERIKRDAEWLNDKARLTHKEK